MSDSIYIYFRYILSFEGREKDKFEFRNADQMVNIPGVDEESGRHWAVMSIHVDHVPGLLASLAKAAGGQYPKLSQEWGLCQDGAGQLDLPASADVVDVFSLNLNDSQNKRDESTMGKGLQDMIDQLHRTPISFEPTNEKKAIAAIHAVLKGEWDSPALAEINYLSPDAKQTISYILKYYNV